MMSSSRGFDFFSSDSYDRYKSTTTSDLPPPGLPFDSIYRYLFDFIVVSYNVIVIVVVVVYFQRLGGAARVLSSHSSVRYLPEPCVSRLPQPFCLLSFFICSDPDYALWMGRPGRGMSGLLFFLFWHRDPKISNLKIPFSTNKQNTHRKVSLNTFVNVVEKL